jgi:hypothetical protein|tara:strand:+ start:1419 stop:1964 length:546 start_codon:yes stop_codon:yes gene_type:complete
MGQDKKSEGEGISYTEVNIQKREESSPADSKQNPEVLGVHSKSEDEQSPEVNIQKRDQLTVLQINLLSALESSMGVVATACETLNISRTNHYKWMKESPEYKENYDDLSNKALDYAETQLMKMIGKGNTAAVIFFLKTKGKERGYVERQEFKVQQDTPDLSGYTTDELLNLVTDSIQLPEA